MVRWLLVVLLVAGLAVAALGLYTEFVQTKVSEPPFETLTREGDFSVRRYQPMVTASVTADGERGAAINDGFRTLANYIFGGNVPNEEIAMTAPVLQRPQGGGEAIAMTAPVLQAPADDGRWTVSFVLPASYTVESAPMPVDQAVQLEEVPAQRMAAVRFDGFHTKENLNRQSARLTRFMEENGLRAAGPPRFAFYDPPWTLPFLRRNEVLIPLAP